MRDTNNLLISTQTSSPRLIKYNLFLRRLVKIKKKKNVTISRE